MDTADELTRRIRNLDSIRQGIISEVVTHLGGYCNFKPLNPIIPITNDTFLKDFTLRLQLHHALNSERLSKKPFEYAFRRSCEVAGFKAKLSNNPTTRGADLIVDTTRFSLKSTAAKQMPKNSLKISKFAEARWIRDCSTKEEYAKKLIEKFSDHLTQYDYVVYLRSFNNNDHYIYQLINIPKNLLALVLSISPNDFEEKTDKGNISAKIKYKETNAYTVTLDGSVEKITLNSIKLNLCEVIAEFKIKKVFEDVEDD